MQAYIQWVNAQLRKRPGSRVVDNLQSDMKDGVALLQLIEVVGMYDFTGTYITLKYGLYDISDEKFL